MKNIILETVQEIVIEGKEYTVIENVERHKAQGTGKRLF